MALPFSLPSLGSGLLFKIGLGVAAVASLVMAYFLFTMSIENENLVKERDRLSLSITDPNTGYIARLTQSRTNVVYLEQAIKTQNEAFKRQSDASKAELERLKKELAAAQARTRAQEKRLAAFMATKPQGVTLEERVTDIDNRILEDLKR
jgi:hypothetical protein